MHTFINEILGCLCMGHTAAQNEERPPLNEKKRDAQTTESLAAEILSTLYAADANDEHPIRRVHDVVRETGWYEELAIAVLTGLENALKAEAPMGQAMKAAYENTRRVVADVLGFAREHPVFCALIALGILVILAPWAVEALGFGELGPIQGTFAALWQSRYAGYVPAGSLFSFLQRLGMVWRMKPVALPAIAF